MLNNCQHNYANSFNITKLGTLEHMFECEKCGDRSRRPEGNPPEKSKDIINSQGDV
jgi:hypothetical protein